MGKGLQRVLIVGAGVAGVELLREIKEHFKTQFRIIGFIDNDPKKIGTIISGVKVLGKVGDLTKVIRKNAVKGIFIAIPSASGRDIQKILKAVKSLQVFFKIVPRSLEIVQGEVKLHQLRDLRVDDLLGEAIIKSDQPTFRQEFEGKRILITGAAGSVGSELCRQLIQFNPELLIALDWWESGIFELGLELRELSDEGNFECLVGNIQDKVRVRGIVKRLRPNFIFHAAAFKHVPLMQDNPLESIKNNVFGTENLAKIAYEEGVDKFIYISTDKAADPTNVMGATKLMGEYIVSTLNSLESTRYSSVRFGNVLDSKGSVVPTFRKQIASGGPVTVTDSKMTRFMMTIPEAIQLVLHASVLGQGGEIFILDMGEPIRIDDLARYMIQISGFLPDKDIKIRYIGMRPGEKLNEKLATEDEFITKTENSRIFKVNPKDNVVELYDLAKLRKSVEIGNMQLALETLKKFAPGIKDSSGSDGQISFARPDVRKEEIDAVSQVLRSGWLTMGEETASFEKEFADYVGAKYAVAVNSCTSALFLSLKALGVGPGDEVIVPAFTFPATVSVVIHCGAIPVFADISKNDFCMDQKSFDRALSKKTKAVIPVHYGGNRAKIKTDIPVIEDSAHFIPRNGDNPNSFTRCYSFYATKNMTTGEGGMMTTSDEKISDWLRKARLHGLSHDAWKRYDVKSMWTYEVEFPGYKFNTTDINSALGRVQLRRLDGFEDRRREVVSLYNQLLDLDNKGTHLYPILVQRRDAFLEYMKESGVGCSFHFLALHKEPAFKKYSRGRLPVTEYVAQRVVTLPLDAVITDEEVKKAAYLVNKFLDKNK